VADRFIYTVTFVHNEVHSVMYWKPNDNSIQKDEEIYGTENFLAYAYIKAKTKEEAIIRAEKIAREFAIKNKS
jgi:hypothetical protein